MSQAVTSGRGVAFEPTVGAPEEHRFTVDFQLGRQDGPKLTCNAGVRVWNAADPALPPGPDQGG